MPDYMNTPITDDEIRRSRGRRSFFPAADAITRQETGRAIYGLRRQGFTDREIGSAIAGVHETHGPEGRYGGLYPPGPGTYYNARRYADTPIGTQIVARANLTKAWQDDLDFNRVANPAAYGSEVSNRAIARLGNNRATNLVTYTLPSGGTVTIPAGSKPPSNGTLTGATRPDVSTSRQLGFSGDPGAIASKSSSQQTPYERSYLMGYNVPGVERPQTNFGYQVGQSLTNLGQMAMTALRNRFNGGGNTQIASASAPPPVPIPDRPRRYFDGEF